MKDTLRRNAFQYFTIAFSMVGIVAMGLLGSAWARWTVAAFCLLVLPSPAVIQKFREHRKLNLRTILDYLRRSGLQAVVEGDEIRWESDGKTNTMRLERGCQLQIYREYPLKEEILGKFESAASVTMDEVFSAKVGVRRPEDGDRGSIFFATEQFCSSLKEFGMILPVSVNILDAAEERQRANLDELMAAKARQRRKIGFVR